jgi:hypothetical protein
VVQIEPKYGQRIAFEASPTVILQRKLLIFLLATRRSMVVGPEGATKQVLAHKLKNER